MVESPSIVMKINFSLFSSSAVVDLRVAFLCTVVFAMWGVVLYLLYNLVYGKDGILDYIELSRKISEVSRDGSLSSERREEMEKRFQLLDKNGNPIELWEL